MKDTTFHGEVRGRFRGSNSSIELRIKAFDAGLDLRRKVVAREGEVD